MNRKKTIKQLMAIGVQRNDAAAFARAYRKVMDARREDLFPEIVKPVMPVVGTVINCQLTPIRAAYLAPASKMEFFRENNEEFTTLFDGMYYELTYNGNKGELYVDAYKKWENFMVVV